MIADGTLPRIPPRLEHPRPDFMRDTYLNLNGQWRFTFDKENLGEQQRWHRIGHPAARAVDATPPLYDPYQDEITVPFPWESKLSGVHQPDVRGAAWYQRVITIPAEWIGKPFLCFGAVDWNAKVWVSGQLVGEHSGGYTPFDLDLSRFVTPGKPATLTVRVWDNCDADTLLGKQTWDWYTPSSGIWQTVYLENRPSLYIAQVHIEPRPEDGAAFFRVSLAGAGSVDHKYHVTVTSPENLFVESVIESDGTAAVYIKVSIPDPHLWSTDDPFLYNAVVTLTPESAENKSAHTDTVHTYFGLRSVSRAKWGTNDYEVVMLNKEPVYLRGVLDQAFHPDGLHTYPSDDAIRADVQLAKDLGLNLLRCHIKLNEPRYYYWADKLGVLVMYDIPCASLYSPTARRYWEEAFRGAIARDYNHPSIIAWILFNETWGLEEHQTPYSWNWVREMYDLAKTLDSSRLAEDNSACLYDHVRTDINTWHFYISDYARARQHVQKVVEQTYEGSPFNYVASRHRHIEDAQGYKQGIEPLLNSEYAGLGASGGDKDISYSFKFLTTDLRRHPKICGYVYTELADIEWEHNGFVNYDRTGKEFGYDHFFLGMTVADLNGADFVGFDCAPCQTLVPGGTFTAPAFVSHWGKPLQTGTLHWKATAIDRFGMPSAVPLAEGQQVLSLQRFDVTNAEPISFALPGENALVTVALWLTDENGHTRARNYVNVEVFGESLAQERTPHGLALRFTPADYLHSSWAQPTLGPQESKFSGGGAGWVEYRLDLPPDFSFERITGLRLLFEAGARSASSRMGWRRSWTFGQSHYPQTHADQKIPTDLTVSINGVEVGKTCLLDDPADSRGVLSLHNTEQHDFASYGFLTRLDATAEKVKEIHQGSQSDSEGGNRALIVRFEVPRSTDAGAKMNGLNLYGERVGAFPVAPTLFLDTEG